MTYRFVANGFEFGLVQVCILKKFAANNLSHPAVLPMAIALATTALTTSFTYYLLRQPWCIQVNADQSQQIVYGNVSCGYPSFNTNLPQSNAKLEL
ncbi:MAG: hypothetical protein ACFB5Z_17965 [Elainellaceae cyanobacterium]